MSITTPLLKPSATESPYAANLKSFITFFAVTTGIRKIVHFFYEQNIHQKALSWEKTAVDYREQRTEALARIHCFVKAQKICHLYTDLLNTQETQWVLNLQHLHLSSLPPLAYPLAITRLNISGNDFQDLSVLSRLENITHLYLNNALKNKKLDLSKLSNLQLVDLRNNEITNLSAIEVPTHQPIEIFLDKNSIEEVPDFWFEKFHEQTKISLLGNDLDLPTREKIIAYILNKKGPFFCFEVETINHANKGLKSIPSIRFSKDVNALLDFRNNDITQLPEDFFEKLPGLYFLDLRNNPLTNRTKQALEDFQSRHAIQQTCPNPLIFFSSKTTIPSEEKLPCKIQDLLQIYHQQLGPVM